MKKFKVFYKEMGLGEKVLEKVVDDRELFWMNIDWIYEILKVEEIG